MNQGYFRPKASERCTYHLGWSLFRRQRLPLGGKDEGAEDLQLQLVLAATLGARRTKIPLGLWGAVFPP